MGLKFQIVVQSFPDWLIAQTYADSLNSDHSKTWIKADNTLFKINVGGETIGFGVHPIVSLVALS